MYLKYSTCTFGTILVSKLTTSAQSLMTISRGKVYFLLLYSSLSKYGENMENFGKTYR